VSAVSQPERAAGPDLELERLRRLLGSEEPRWLVEQAVGVLDLLPARGQPLSVLDDLLADLANSESATE
jgi:hypothetical protein